LTYSLGLAVGDRIEYPAETGELLVLQVVGALGPSLFQGALILDESTLSRYFPTRSGWRWFLFKGAKNPHELASHLEEALADLGMDVRDCAEILAGFYKVQNTYIGIFQYLGGLGLLLGAGGLGLLLMTNVTSRIKEIAVLGACGWSRGQIARLLIAEHSFLYASGLAWGSIASASVLVLGSSGAADGVQAGPFVRLVLLMIAVGFISISAAVASLDTSRSGEILQRE